MKEEQTKLFPEENKFWTLYNRSQTQEKTLFLRLLKELCDAIVDEKEKHKIFCTCLKTYTMKSSRRLIGELQLCYNAGYVDRVPHFNSTLNYMRQSDLSHTLQVLIKLSSLPLKAIERKFACDSSGFGMNAVHEKWSHVRQHYQKHHKYLKAHITFGVLSNIVTSCRITEGTKADAPLLPEMVDETAENFTLEEYSADKAYLSRKNLEAIHKHNCLPLIPFKANSTSKSKGTEIWGEMYKFFHQNRKLYMKKYHLRSNAESGFRMIKARFGDSTNMKAERGMKNDILSKILCHNLCVLCQEIFLLNLDFDFAQLKKKSAQLENL